MVSYFSRRAQAHIYEDKLVRHRIQRSHSVWLHQLLYAIFYLTALLCIYVSFIVGYMSYIA